MLRKAKAVVKDNVQMWRETKLPYKSPKTGTTIWTANRAKGNAHAKGKRTY